MAEFKLPRIRFTWKGAWSAGTAYIKDDIVRFGGKSYVCLIGHTASPAFTTDLFNVNTATEPDTPAPRWVLWLDGHSWTGSWIANRLYNVGDIVRYGAIIYVCTQSHTSTAETIDGLEVDITKWTEYAIASDWKTEWAANTRYKKGDVVKFSGIAYRCTVNHISSGSYATGIEADPTKWEVLTYAENWLLDWTPATQYKLADIVKYGGIVYRCIENHQSAGTAVSGLEADQDRWEVVTSGVEFKGNYSSPVRYKINDIVKYGASLWICSTYYSSGAVFDTTKWTLYFPGVEYENDWNSLTAYQPGDIIHYGGYNYLAKDHNQNADPVSNPSKWQLLTIGNRILGEWSSSTSYRVGDVVRLSGGLFRCILNNSNVSPPNASYWETIVPGTSWKNKWTDGASYVIGDVVTYIGSAFVCKQAHTASSLINSPPVDVSNTIWGKFIEGDLNNRLNNTGGLLTYSNNDFQELLIGAQGTSLVSNGTLPEWRTYQVSQKVYYVATTGTDSPSYGTSIDTPWKTIRYACSQVTGPATILIKTGNYKETLPISIPANVALVGDELRGVVVEPAAGNTTSNMFYVRNGTGIRNMTLQGLSGTLGPLNTYLTRRPTAGAYVSLDPGTGPTDSSVWITTKSPYIQNVTTFGTGCVGLKIDGALHTAGNKSVVANDFTQILSDGIGVWCTNLARTELVSVFSYYGHIGYLAENGGKIRATNGNSSYGTYGCVSEGFDASETPITAVVDNRSKEAQISGVISGGTSGEILAVEYGHAGQTYSTATYTFNGPGTGVSAAISVRDNAVSEVRLLQPTANGTTGGGGYLITSNNAQAGDSTSITLATNDPNTETEYLGMRIMIISGTGVGHYGYVQSYNPVSKIASIYSEASGTAGWDHVVPGTPFLGVDTSSVYVIEPRVTFAAPTYAATARTLSSSANWSDVDYANGNFVAVAAGSGNILRSTNGTSWATTTSALSALQWNKIKAATIGATTYHVAINSGSATVAYSSNGGSTWSTASLSASSTWADFASNGTDRIIAISSDGLVSTTTTLSSWSAATALPSATWTGIAYGNGKWVAIGNSSTTLIVAISTNNGTSWTTTTYNTPGETFVDTFTSITFGGGLFVVTGSSNGLILRSANAVNWSSVAPDPSLGDWRVVKWGQGTFVALAGNNGNTQRIATSPDGVSWTLRVLTSTAAWRSLAFGSPSNSPIWTFVSNGTSGASFGNLTRATGRVSLSSGRIREVKIWEPGSGYTSTPSVTITDPNNTSDAIFSVRLSGGVLGQPTFLSRGSGYLSNSTTATVTGNGYAEIYQVGRFLYVDDLSLLPGPGANLNISGISNVTFKIVSIQDLGFGNARFQISPELTAFNAPAHGVSISIRENYSQVRLTGHDFLEVGVGNFTQTNYPTVNEFTRAPENEVLENGGGRVFYTSTDQDGNFRVGELFRVEQSTGIVTISADTFNLGGLEELQLGGVSIGGSAVVIREFSTDGTFTADSNNVVPTQRAIKSYLQRRISGGGSDAQTAQITAGTVIIGPNIIGTTTDFPIKIPVTLNLKKIPLGSYAALGFFYKGFSGDVPE